MTQSIVLYCKSYRRDFLRVKRLLISLQKYNRDKLPFYISTPTADRELLLEVLGKEDQNFSYIWIS